MNDTLKASGRIGAELGAAMAEIEVLREQVKVLQSDANSWQSGYDKGRHDGAKHRKSEVEQLRQHKNEYMDAAEATRKALLADIESLRNGLKNARYRIEQGRVWNGMGWTLTGLHAHQQQKALDEIDAALSQQAEPLEQAPAQDDRDSVIAHIELCITNLKAEHQTNPRVIAEVLYNIGYSRATRPAQTEQQPTAVPEGWLIELGFDVLDRPFRFVDSKSHTPTIKVILPACGPVDSSSWDLRDEIARRIGSMLATSDTDTKED